MAGVIRVAPEQLAGMSAQLTGGARMFGLAESDQAPRVVVAEYISEKVTRQFGRLHHFSLLSVKRGGHALAT